MKPNTSFLGLLGVAQRVAEGFRDLNPTYDAINWFVKIEEGIVSKSDFDKYVPAHKAYVRDLIAKGHKAKTGYWAELGGARLAQ